MISLNELCRLISLPDEAADLVCKTAERLDWAAAAPAIKLFYSRDTWMDGVCALRELFSQEQENKNGFHMLTCMLEASRKTFEDYINLGSVKRFLQIPLRCSQDSWENTKRVLANMASTVIFGPAVSSPWKISASMRWNMRWRQLTDTPDSTSISHQMLL